MLQTNKKRNIFQLLFVIGFCVSICEGSQSTSAAKITEIGNFTPITTNTPSVKLTAANAVNVASPKDGLNKRNIKFKDLSENSAASGKSYDPPPEYYRGPGSTVSTASSGYSNRDSATADFISKPVTFPDTTGRSKYGNSGSEYNAWQLLRGSAAGHHNSQDRISVGHYGSPDHGTSHGGTTASSFLHGNAINAGYGGGYGGYGYDGYGYSGGVTQYPVTTHGHGHGHDGADGGGHYYESGAGAGLGGSGIPFDVYGSKGHYAGVGGEYSYSSYPDPHEPVAHKGYGVDWQHKALLAKSFLIPLASAAVLGIAAALVSNPLLLQLGTVSGSALVGKRRKRRDLNAVAGSAAAVAYRAHQERRLARA